MSEHPSQSAENSSGVAQADNGGTATVNYSTHHHYASGTPRPSRAVHLDAPPDLFIGRGPELAALHHHLVREGAVVYIPGFPGRGKSTLANQYAHEHKDEYQTVHWLPCHSKSLVEIAAEFAWQLDLKLDGDLEANLKHLRGHCARNRCLLILDNVDDEAPAGMLLGGRSSVVITTWHTNLKFLRRVPSIPLPVFTEDECFVLFRKKIGAKEVDRHLAESRLLFDRLEKHPFALDIAASLIVEDPRYTIAGMARNLPADITALFAEAIAALSPAARSLLAAMAVCAPEGFRLSLAAEIAGVDEAAALDALYVIRARSLADELDRDTHRYRLHALVRVAAEPANELRDRHAETVRAQFKQWEANWRTCGEDMADWRTAFQWSLSQSGQEPWAVAQGLAFTGYALTTRLGRLVEAHEIGARMIDQAQRVADRWCLQASLGNQALLLKAWGRLDDAMALHKREEALCDELGDKAGLAASYGNQALILKAWGRLDDAMALLKRQEALCDELGDKAGLAASYGNQALLLQAWGRLDDAMALLKRQEALFDELGDKAGLAASYGNQALILKAWGRLDDAMALHQREEALCDELGDKAGLAASYGNQALLLKAWGRLDDAMALHQREEALCDELGDKAGLAASYGNQALLLQAWGRLDDAMALLKRQEALFDELGDKAGLAASYGNQALILKAWGRLDDAMALHQREEALCDELGDKAGLAASYGNQALLLKAWGRLDDAMALHQREEALCDELGDKAGLARTYGNQALLLKAWGRLDDAMALHQREEALCDELGDKAGLARSFANQGQTARSNGDHTTGRSKLQEALVLFRELGLPRERDLVQSWLDEAAEPPSPESP